jgi:hypothetical protein
VTMETAKGVDVPGVLKGPGRNPGRPGSAGWANVPRLLKRPGRNPGRTRSTIAGMTTSCSHEMTS